MNENGQRIEVEIDKNKEIFEIHDWILKTEKPISNKTKNLRIHDANFRNLISYLDKLANSKSC